MRNYLTQTLLLFTSVISLYILVQLANLTLRQQNTELMALAVRATVAARPTTKPIVMEIPVTVEVTRLVALPPLGLPATIGAPASTITPVPVMTVAPANDSGGASNAANTTILRPTSVQPPPAADHIVAVADLLQAATVGCATTSGNAYPLIPMEAADTQHPDNQHGDLNLALRGYQPSRAAKAFVAYTGPVDAGAPQLAATFADHRRPLITNVYQVRDWRWDCGEHGCASDWLTQYDVTLLGVATTPGEAIFFPKRDAEIYGGGYTAVVLYAEETRLTIGYTRDGTVANGYAAQFENFCVDPNLLFQYRTAHADGRWQLPGLHNGDPVGTANGELLIAIRDRGTFMDPRSEQDWWR